MSKLIIDRLKDELFSYPDKRKYVVLATTANKNNPEFYVGGLRKGSNFVAANFIFNSPKQLFDVIKKFDGDIDAFLVDTEIKNDFDNLEECAKQIINHSPIAYIKPNDMTVLSLDIWVSTLIPNLNKKKVLVVGAGNIGSKISILLAERGAKVGLFGRNKKKLQRISDGLSEVVRGNGSIVVSNKDRPAHAVDIILGCTPGLPAITSNMIADVHSNTVIIDVGNGSLFPDAIQLAIKKKIKLLCLSPEAGFTGWVEAHSHALAQIETLNKRNEVNGVKLIPSGIFGGYGDVLVDNPDQWMTVIGVCDGKGDILPQKKANKYMNKIKED